MASAERGEWFVYIDNLTALSLSLSLSLSLRVLLGLTAEEGSRDAACRRGHVNQSFARPDLKSDRAGVTDQQQRCRARRDPRPGPTPVSPARRRHPRPLSPPPQPNTQHITSYHRCPRPCFPVLLLPLLLLLD